MMTKDMRFGIASTFDNDSAATPAAVTPKTEAASTTAAPPPVDGDATVAPVTRQEFDRLTDVVAKVAELVAGVGAAVQILADIREQSDAKLQAERRETSQAVFLAKFSEQILAGERALAEGERFYRVTFRGGVPEPQMARVVAVPNGQNEANAIDRFRAFHGITGLLAGNRFSQRN